VSEATLQIEYADTRRQLVPLTAAETVIGRASNREQACNLPLEDQIVSRRHARITRDPKGAWWIEDLQSKNGTFVNDELIKRTRLASGDRIGIGGCRLVFAAGPSESRVVLSDTPSDVSSQTNAFSATQRLVLPQQRLERLYELNERLTGKFDRDALLGEVLDICMELLRFERAGIAVWKGESHPPQWVHMRGQRGPDGDFRISRSLVDRALTRAERILVNDTAECVDPTASMISNRIRSAMCVPMAYHDSVRGVIYGDRVTSAGGYTREDIDFFAALGRMGAMGLANCALLEEMRQRQQVEIQLNLARQIQNALFPAEPLRSNGVSIDAVNDPGQKISGDYYDYFVRPDGQIVVLVADVSGKGVPASLLTANLQAAVRVTLGGDGSLVESVREINRLICQNVSEGRFITGIIGLLDPARREYASITAGHPAPYLIENGTVQMIKTEPALPFGLEPDYDYQPQIIELNGKPSMLVMFSDGIPDAENDGGDYYGLERLCEVLKSSSEKSTSDVVGRIRTSIRQFTRNHPQTDDITILAMQVE